MVEPFTPNNVLFRKAEPKIMSFVMRYSPRSLFVVAALFATGSAFCLEPEVIWERVSPSVVRVETTLLDGEQMQGSGFVCEIEGKKYVLSNRHVVVGAKQVRFGHLADKLTSAPSFRISPELDLALIDLPKGLQIPALRKRQTELKTGERVYAIGFPLGLNKSITQGLVSSQTEKVIQFDAPISSGSSGGPLVDKDGLVVGVVTAGSFNSSQEVAQNLNFAIKTAFVPKLSLFRDPIISFYDAWRELVNVENALIEGLKEQRVIEINNYLQTELFKSTDLLRPRAGWGRWFEESHAESLKNIAGKHGNVSQAAKAVAVYLRKQISEFDKIPELFIALGKQELLTEFARDNRPGGLFRLQIEESEIPPLLRISLEHVKAKYEDTAYQIEFLADALPKLKQRDAEFIKAVLAVLQLDEQLPQNQRASVRLDYKALGKTPTETQRLLFFGKSFIPYRPENSDPTIFTKRFERKLSAKEEFTFSGGFERNLTKMFHRLAIAKLQSGNIQKAIGYVRNDVSNRKFGDYRLLAHFTAGSGDFDAAYGFYEKAFNDSADTFDPFTLEMDGRTIRSLIAHELQDDGPAFWSYPVPVRKNLSDWHRYLLRKGALGLSNLPTVDEALTSKAFREATEFEQYFVLHSFQLRALHDTSHDTSGGFEKYEKFLKAVKSDSAAYRVYAKFF